MSAPRTVLYISNSPKIGGGNRMLMELASRLDRARFSPAFVIPGLGPMADWAKARGIPSRIILGIDTEGWGTILLRAAAIARWSRTSRVRIVHASAPLGMRSAALAARVTGMKRVCHVQFPPAQGELDWALRFGADAVVTCYRRMIEELDGTFTRPPGARFLAIPNAVDTVRFAPEAPAGEDRESLRLGAKHVVVIVGHLSEVKGHPTFLRAAARIARELEGCAFLVLGGETIAQGFRATLEALARSLGIAERVRFLGNRDDVPAVLRASDVMALPSLAEGLPLAVLEAQAAGLPVVASDVNGTPEAILDGKTGFLVPPSDPEALAAAILRVLRDPALARRIGAAGRAHILESFTFERFAERVQELYEELLDSARS